MTEKELLNKIKESAEEINLPDSLTPEQMKAELNRRKHKTVSFHFSPKKSISAAAVLLLCGVLSGIAFQTSHVLPEPSLEPVKTAEESNILSESIENDAEENEDVPLPKQNAGKLYTVAKSYDEVYDKLESYHELYRDVITAEAEGAIDIADDIAFEEKTIAQNESNAAMKLSELSTANSKKESHSTTNLQTTGVDESDIIKTDGRSIYTVAERKVIIADTADHDLKQIGSIDPGLDPADSVLELYVDNDRLLLLVQHYDTTLEETSVNSDTSTEESVDSGYTFLESSKKANMISTNYSTVLYVYDIADPAHPLLKGTGTQDGLYETSRKIGDILYLFTRKESLAQSVNFENDYAKGGIIPCVNGQEIPYDHIYLPDAGDSGLILSSFDINQPDKTIDEVMIIHNYAQIYVGNDSIYLYHYDFNKIETIQIAKFGMKNGMLNAINATSVKGEIYDSFAINEYQNTLRLLTTSYDNNYNSINHLYLFDENMDLASSLDNIAPGEEIYAARYLGTTAYFITYHNTDPLFAVDLSDIKNPKILGELKITGFSEYLHFWGNDKLLGIGYETDPETGNQKGMKLVMFDISNPAELKVIDSMVLNEYYFSPALYNYKCVLADPQKNLIGFAAEYNSNTYDYLMDYNIYAWENDHFTKKLREQLPEHISSDTIRGLYIGNRFYIAGLTEITGFDMEQDFQKKWHLTLEK